jgi:hypothetical protein
MILHVQQLFLHAKGLSGLVVVIIVFVTALSSVFHSEVRTGTNILKEGVLFSHKRDEIFLKLRKTC